MLFYVYSKVVSYMYQWVTLKSQSLPQIPTATVTPRD